MMQNNRTESTFIDKTQSIVFAFALIPGAININTNA